MYFKTDSLFPENRGPLIITAAPYGPQWMPSDYPEDIAVSWDAQVDNFKGYGNIARGGIFDLEDGTASTAPWRR
jgi:hypothetical protein